MRHFLFIFVVVLTFSSLPMSHGFSLSGPRPPWMTGDAAADCYPTDDFTWANSAPMDIDEEYRFPGPVITYGFTSDFVTFFGKRGIDEVREAIDMIQGLPPLESLDVNDYPQRGAFRLNHRAAALGLSDLKSTALTTVLYFLGLEDPTRYAYAARNALVINSVPVEYYVGVKNYDPEGFFASPYINGALYTVQPIGCPDVIPVQAFGRNAIDRLPAAARGNGSFGGRRIVNNPGTFITGLTRDDVGALKYLYHPKNYNFENLGYLNLAIATNQVSTFSANYSEVLIESATPSTNLFGTLSPFDSAVTLTNATSVGSFGGLSPYDSAVSLTNATTVGAGGGGVGGGVNAGGGQVGGGLNAVAQQVVIPAGVRGGAGKLSFLELSYDSILGQFIEPVNISYDDNVFATNRFHTLRVVRNVTAPDIVISADDLFNEPFDWGGPPADLFNQGVVGVNYQNSDPGTPQDAGSGLVESATMSFNTTRLFGQVGLWSDPLNAWFDEEGLGLFPNAPLGIIWASFDGSTEEPYIYPQGVDFEELEQLIMSVSQ